ncbi:MAG: CDP-diacylglycerol--serine O-phosphatidyltransferase [Thermodesulfobacteria bacterium]|nr:CDP-diacylglycerol--serine O-phosphatidyltransferase [Thermodesulfobacteriota bacterium]
MTATDTRCEKRRKPPRKRAYILPNLLTSISLFAGFYSLVSSIDGKFMAAAWAILVSGIFDGLDGRVARITGTTSKFGLEYDSLADLVAFGVAPGILAFTWALRGFGRLGWLAAFLYVATTALRLARFNTLGSSGPGSKSFFLGLPCPSAAAMVATTVLMCNHFGISGPVHHYGLLIMIYGLSFLMVSNVRYYSFKEMQWFNQHPFRGLVAVLLTMVIIAIEPKVTLFVLFLFYCLSGPLLYPLGAAIQRRREETKATFNQQ